MSQSRPYILTREEQELLAECELERQRLLREAAELAPPALARKFECDRSTVERAQRRMGVRA